MFAALAPFRERAAARAVAPADAARERIIAAELREMGHAALAAGTAVLVVTTAALAAALDDRTAAFLVAATVTLAVGGLLYWAILYHRRHPLPPRARRARPSTAVAALAATATEKATATDTETATGDEDAPHDNGRSPDLALLGSDAAGTAAAGADTVAVDADPGFAAVPDEPGPVSRSEEEDLALPASVAQATGARSSLVNGLSGEEDEIGSGVAAGVPAHRSAQSDEPAPAWPPQEEKTRR
jgi:hypothetical protein